MNIGSYIKPEETIPNEVIDNWINTRCNNQCIKSMLVYLIEDNVIDFNDEDEAYWFETGDYLDDKLN